MERSYNGWPASKNPDLIDVVPFNPLGVSFPGGVVEGDVHTIFTHVVEQLHRRVEPIMREPGCWGYHYRMNRNASNLSNHSSATAIDYNAPKHPNGVAVARTFSDREVLEIFKIMREIPELDDCIRWGGEYKGTPDSMHFEITTTDKAKLRRVAQRIANKEEFMSYENWSAEGKRKYWADFHDNTFGRVLGRTGVQFGPMIQQIWRKVTGK